MESKIYTSDKKRMLLFIVVWGIMIGSALSILDGIVLVILSVQSFWWIRSFLEWPVGLITGCVIALFAAIYRYTTVKIVNDEIWISGRFRKKQLSLQDFAEPLVRRKTHSVLAIKFTIVKCYLQFSSHDRISAYRLYGFGEKGLEEVLAGIREQQSDRMDVSDKVEIVNEHNAKAEDIRNFGYSSYENEKDQSPDNEFLFPADVLLRQEKRVLRMIDRIFLILTLCFFILFGSEMYRDQVNWTHVLFLVICILIILATPVIRLRMNQRKKICAERILIDGAHIWIREQCYSYSNILSIRMTSPRKRTDSIFPVQYYLTVCTQRGKDRYWLGSEYSFGDYDKICEVLQSAMILYPDKLKYIK